MIKMLRTGAVSAVVAAMALSSAANAAETATATAQADVVQAFTVTNRTALDFGAIVVNGTSGTVTVAPTGARTCGATLVCHGSTTAALFEVAGGSRGKRLLVQLPNTSGGPIKMLHSSHTGAANPSLEIELNGFSSDASVDAATGQSYITVPAAVGAPPVALNVGGVASFGGDEAEGVYTATFSVLVDYE